MEEEEEDEEDAKETEHVVLPVKLQAIVDDIYYSVNGTQFNQVVIQCPALELSEFSFVPLSLSASQNQHWDFLKSTGLLAEHTRIA